MQLVLSVRVAQYLKLLNLPSEYVVGVEGIFGILMLVAIMLPIAAHLPGTGTHAYVHLLLELDFDAQRGYVCGEAYARQSAYCVYCVAQRVTASERT